MPSCGRETGKKKRMLYLLPVQQTFYLAVPASMGSQFSLGLSVGVSPWLENGKRLNREPGIGTWYFNTSHMAYHTCLSPIHELMSPETQFLAGRLSGSEFAL